MPGSLLHKHSNQLTHVDDRKVRELAELPHGSPGIETIVIVLPHDLAVSKRQEDGESGPHVPARRDAAEGHRQGTDPVDLDRDLIARGHHVENLVTLRGHHLAATLSGLAQRGQISGGPFRDEAVGKFHLHHVLSEERQVVLGLTLPDGLEIPASDFEISLGCVHIETSDLPFSLPGRRYHEHFAIAEATPERNEVIAGRQEVWEESRGSVGHGDPSPCEVQASPREVRAAPGRERLPPETGNTRPATCQPAFV